MTFNDILFRMDRSWLSSAGASDIAYFGPLPQAVSIGFPANTAASEARAPINDGNAAHAVAPSDFDRGGNDAPLTFNPLGAPAGHASAVAPAVSATDFKVPVTNVFDTGTSVISIALDDLQHSFRHEAGGSSTPYVSPAPTVPAATPALPLSPQLPDVTEEQQSPAGIDMAIGPADEVMEDALELLGTDPAGGITTLVSLVTVTDLIDLRDIDSESSIGDRPLAMLDALSADAVLIDPLFAETGGGSVDPSSSDVGPVDLPDALNLPDLGAQVPTDLPIDPLGLG